MFSRSKSLTKMFKCCSWASDQFFLKYTAIVYCKHGVLPGNAYITQHTPKSVFHHLHHIALYSTDENRLNILYYILYNIFFISPSKPLPFLLTSPTYHIKTHPHTFCLIWMVKEKLQNVVFFITSGQKYSKTKSQKHKPEISLWICSGLKKH